METFKYGNVFEKFPVEKDRLYINGLNTYMCSEVSYASLGTVLCGNKIDIVVTDPPWTESLNTEFRKSSGSYERSLNEVLLEFVGLLQRFCPDAVICILMGKKKWDEIFKEMLIQNGSQTFAIFDFGFYFWIGSFNQNVKLQVPKSWGEKDIYYLMNKLFENMKPQTMLDCFAGKGTYSIQANKHGIKTYNIEINPRKLAHFHRYNSK